MATSSVLFLQEHCLYQSMMGEFNKIGDINFHGVSAMDESTVRSGRPHGGCAIIWRSNLDCSFTPIDTTSDRICAAKMTMSSGTSVLLVNVHLPCDSRFRDEKYQCTTDILDCISTLIGENECDLKVIGGDFNAEMNRTTPHVYALQNFISSNNLLNGLNHPVANVGFTFESAGTHSRSLIDHVLACEGLFDNIREYKAIESVDNFSDHMAVICLFDCSVLERERQERIYKKRPAWHKATHDDITQFSTLLDTLLQRIFVSKALMSCDNYHCTQHREQLDSLLTDIINACIQAEDSCIPKTCMKHTGCIPGWSDNVSGLRHKALHFHALWKTAGSPDDGVLAEDRRKSRREYHKALKKCKKDRDHITASKIAEKMAGSKTKDFWREISRLKKSPKSVASIVDGRNHPKDIAELFYNKFKVLYSSVPSSDEEVESIKKQVNSRLKSYTGSHVISSRTVTDVLRKLKSGKQDGVSAMMSNCIIHAPVRLSVLLAFYFSSMLCHGYASDPLLLGTMCPIPKSSNISDADKYRAITLCSSITKLFELIVLNQQSASLMSDALQFGYKSGSSTALCTTLLKEVASKFVSEGSNVYCILLDASKAFDKVCYSRLFEILLERHMDPLYIRCLLYMYLNQSLRVKWQNSLSDSFKVLNGVRQGGVLSPILFCLYMDQLLTRLRESQNGCYVGPHFSGAFCYADDIALLSPSLKGLKEMLKICESFSSDYKMMFNGQKSQFIVFRRKSQHFRLKINFCGTEVLEQETVTHLGHILHSDLNKYNVDTILQQFYKQYNMLCCKLGRVPSYILAKLFGTHCSSFYGSMTLPLRGTKRLQVAWRKSLRRVWRVPAMTHVGTIRSLNDGLCDEHMFIARAAKFIVSACNHETDLVSFIVKVSCQVKLSTIRENIAHVCEKLQIDDKALKDMQADDIGTLVKDLCEKNCKQKDCLTNAITELSKVRDGLYDCPLSKQECEQLINFLCII